MTQFLASKFRRLESRALPRNEDAKTRTRGLFLIAFGAVVLISALMAGVGMPTGNDLRSFVCEAGVVILIFGLAFLGETPFIRARMAIGDVSLEISREGKSPPVLAGTLYFSPPLRPDQFAQPWDLRVGMDPPYRHARLFTGDLMRFAAQHAVPLFSPEGTTARFVVQVPDFPPPSGDSAYQAVYLDLKSPHSPKLEMRFDLPSDLIFDT